MYICYVHNILSWHVYHNDMQDAHNIPYSSGGPSLDRQGSGFGSCYEHLGHLPQTRLQPIGWGDLNMEASAGSVPILPSGIPMNFDQSSNRWTPMTRPDSFPWWRSSLTTHRWPSWISPCGQAQALQWWHCWLSVSTTFAHRNLFGAEWRGWKSEAHLCTAKQLLQKLALLLSASSWLEPKSSAQEMAH